MSQLTLKKLIFRKKDARVMVDHLIQAVGSPITILDAEGQFLLGDDHQTSGGRYPIQLEGETLGWVLGGEQAAAVAALLAQLVLKEFEKKALAAELLDKYRELNILYDLSEKMAACAEFKAMAQLAIDEAGRLIDASGGAVMFLVEDSQELKTIATLNQTRGSTSSLRLGEGIVGRVAQTGKAELVNDVWSDPGFIAGDSDISSLICVPLKAKQQVVGVVTVFHEQPTTYTAENLKLLTALASQAAPMLEHAFVYETKLKEARAREDRLEQQLLEFRIGLDETKQLLHRTLDITPPFDFLTFGQKEWLVDRVQPASYPDGWIISSPDDTEYDRLFLLLKGRLRLIALEGDEAGTQKHIEAPAYFGEQAVFFDQPPRSSLVAEGPVHCVALCGQDIRSLVATNSMFSQAFATALRNKQRIFHGYDAFVNLLFTQAEAGTMQLRDLVEVYRGLHSILHQAGSQKELDLEALTYVIPRLPDNITSALALYLAEDLPEMFQPVKEVLRSSSRRAKKREFYEILPNKIMVLLRDRMTDTVDLVTKLCIYAVETGKIRARLAGTPLARELAQLAVQGGSAGETAKTVAELPFLPEEIARLEALFEEKLLARLYEILVQTGDLTIYVQQTDRRYTTTASEMWLSQIRKALGEVIGLNQFDGDYDVHLISGNTHSVHNCLSTWLHERADTILGWASTEVPESLRLAKAADRLYLASRAWLQAHPDQVARRYASDQSHGIYVLDDPSFTGIEVRLIDANRLGSMLDPDIELPTWSRRTIIVNIDYAYGQQAQLIMRNLILLFGHRIRSISIFGKSGAVVGSRGDLLLPDQLLLQTDDQLYPLPNHDLTPADFDALGFERPVHQGTLLTVLGTVMQSREMLYYYRHFWNVIGMEMEGSFYLREIRRARSLRLIPQDVRLRFAYYTSDTPLESSASLTSSLSAAEGLPPVYAITRAVLRRILMTERN